ncbi:hypothetical protein DSL92_04595 [Billgrantia gudaonensis]|uniref:Uncharacterized protein n=1 Tax=Billgrantia gudaonensis TaxID=376427 RepID=A0A3S0NE58_9GAMM|nr:hypothetical protein DSL92_04595 [Halomonas gudaonensis]
MPDPRLLPGISPLRRRVIAAFGMGSQAFEGALEARVVSTLRRRRSVRRQPGRRAAEPDEAGTLTGCTGRTLKVKPVTAVKAGS